MSHASRREGAVDVPPGYKEEPAPVADDLVSELPVAVRLSFHPSIHTFIHPSIHPSIFPLRRCLLLPVSAPSRCSCTGPPRSNLSTPFVGGPIPVRLAKRRVSGFMVCPHFAGPRLLPPPLLPAPLPCTRLPRRSHAEVNTTETATHAFLDRPTLSSSSSSLLRLTKSSSGLGLLVVATSVGQLQLDRRHRRHRQPSLLLLLIELPFSSSSSSFSHSKKGALKKTRVPSLPKSRDLLAML
jgi:hypothetical protein